MREIFELLSDSLIDAFIDTLKIAPFLFFIYLLMEFIYHKAGDKTNKLLLRSGKVAPMIGGILGVFPQCGFSAACSSLFSGGVIGAGTLLAVFLSTSDEMLPVMITSSVPITTILKVLLTKVIIGALVGMAAELLISAIKHKHHDHSDEETHIHEMCEHDGCHCEKGIWLSALHHFLGIAVYILIFSFVLNVAISAIGEEKLASLLVGTPVLGQMISALIGLIPNCASSIVITDLYVNGIITSGVMMSGLLAGSGVGLMVLFKTNKNIKQNILIALSLYGSGVLFGVLIDALKITF